MTYARFHAVAEELARLAPDDIRGYEITGEGIVLTAWPSRPHEGAVLRVRRELAQHLGPSLIAAAGAAVENASVGRLRRPDVIVMPYGLSTKPTTGPFHPDDVTLVVDVVPPSGHGCATRTGDYSAMGIEVYLLVDPRRSTLSVFTDPGPHPDGPRYRARHDYVFGDDVSVGPWKLRTTELRPYPTSE
ncbi:Uma2 family endonuclease [Actinacidiphila guanduensis]|uniref:Putative restriction endonuclease n=1 Tax=Actinacidiphila guanduensis TaxID=310781 RepID=A0A1G9YIW4_9ACTN|nr:Uma2 family endonuclease [Actinacidiphila guanduensis]SDN09178.1 Putative restriction endonuclease [Actinacidiphila guanduensis]